MKERPILFSGPMVRAIIDGRKTQTRRVMTCQPTATPAAMRVFLDKACTKPVIAALWDAPESEDCACLCPYGVLGDRLWVRETWAAEDALDDLAPRNIPPGGPIWYAEDRSLRGCRGILHMGKNRPGMFMPRHASRITLEIVSVRVERLQEISDADCIAEGVMDHEGHYFSADDAPLLTDKGRAMVRGGYHVLWDSINAKRAPWESNPWVWVIEFRRVE